MLNVQGRNRCNC